MRENAYCKVKVNHGKSMKSSISNISQKADNGLTSHVATSAKSFFNNEKLAPGVKNIWQKAQMVGWILSTITKIALGHTRFFKHQGPKYLRVSMVTANFQLAVPLQMTGKLHRIGHFRMLTKTLMIIPLKIEKL